MRMLLGTGALAGLLALGVGIAAAQDAKPEPARAEPVEVRVGATVYELPPDEGLVACIDARTDDLLGSTLVLRPFVRGVSEGWLALPAFATEASGALVAAERGQCYVLDPEGIAG